MGMLGDIAQLANSISNMTAGQDQALAQLMGGKYNDVMRGIDAALNSGSPSSAKTIAAQLQAASGSPAQAAKLAALLVNLRSVRRQLDDIKDQIEDVLKDMRSSAASPDAQAVDALMKQALSDMTSDSVDRQLEAQKEMQQAQRLFEVISSQMSDRAGMIKAATQNI